MRELFGTIRFCDRQATTPSFVSLLCKVKQNNHYTPTKKKQTNKQTKQRQGRKWFVFVSCLRNEWVWLKFLINSLDLCTFHWSIYQWKYFSKQCNLSDSFHIFFFVVFCYLSDPPHSSPCRYKNDKHQQWRVVGVADGLRIRFWRKLKKKKTSSFALPVGTVFSYLNNCTKTQLPFLGQNFGT